MREMIYLGALSGTSMDAIDIAAVDLSQTRPQLLAHANYPIAAPLRASAQRLQSGACRLIDYARLDREFGRLFADSIGDFIKQHNLSISTIEAIGLHGQTILHYAESNIDRNAARTTARTTESSKPPAAPLTLQVADPNIVAYQSGLTVVADFRRADIAAGGQGAPLTPALHALMFGESHKKNNTKQAVLNLGGIANISVLDGNRVLVGFDSGPGNCLMDAWSRRHHNQAYDQNGSWAAAHPPDSELLRALLDDPFFSQAPPKSTCTSYFSLDWLTKHRAKNPPTTVGSVAATLAELTAISVANAVKDYIAADSELLVCGGGAHNQHLMARLHHHTQMRVRSTAAKGLHPDWVEAVAFAWLAKQRLENRSGNVAAATGARAAVVLGAIYQPRQQAGCSERALQS